MKVSVTKISVIKVARMSQFPSRDINIKGIFWPSSENSVKQTLLLVDDNKNCLKALTTLFEEHYRVLCSNNPDDAISMANINEVDLILLDVDMPKLNGYDVCKILKQNHSTYHIPIIFVTALDSLEEESKGLAVGAVDYISKPYHCDVILARVKNHMQLVRYRKALQALSHTDGLTGLPNRRQLENMLKREWHSAVRGGHSLAFLFIDIDNFKSYNDIYGHVAGDNCLKNVSKTLETTRRRRNDFLARYGGEEFVAILPNASKSGAKKIASAMLDQVRQMNIQHSGNSPYNVVTVSIGLSWYFPPKTENNYSTHGYEELLMWADQLLYKAKRLGRNRVVMREYTGEYIT